MWKCKKCGSDDIWGHGMFIITDFDKNGEPKTDSDIKYQDYTDTYCHKCHTSGDNLKDIAEWVEDEGD